MADITVPANIPQAAQADVKAAIVAIGKHVLGARYPVGYDPANLSQAQVANLFELLTREFWRREIAAVKANAFAEAARVAAASEPDPFP